MELIDRYVYEVGRYLPHKNRKDIQTELRSSLSDALEDRSSGEPLEADVVELLKEFGPPKQVAASYYPEGQYLIGPALFPLFRLIIGIVLAAVLGAQLIAFSVAYMIAGEPINPLEALASMFNSIPATLGWVVVVFAILQYFEVRPDTEDEPWDPRTLPAINETETVNRTERIAGIVFGVLFLALFAAFVGNNGIVGITSFPGGKFIYNPILGQYFGWIVLLFLTGIAIDIYLLWKGRWTTGARIAKICANLFGIAILFLLFQAHTDWLAAHGAGGFLTALEQLPEDVTVATELISMFAFRIAFGVALIVTIVDTVVSIYRLIRSKMAGNVSLDAVPVQKSRSH